MNLFSISTWWSRIKTCYMLESCPIHLHFDQPLLQRISGNSLFPLRNIFSTHSIILEHAFLGSASENSLMISWRIRSLLIILVIWALKLILSHFPKPGAPIRGGISTQVTRAFLFVLSFLHFFSVFYITTLYNSLLFCSPSLLSTLNWPLAHKKEYWNSVKHCEWYFLQSLIFYNLKHLFSWKFKPHLKLRFWKWLDD